MHVTAGGFYGTETEYVSMDIIDSACRVGMD